MAFGGAVTTRAIAVATDRAFQNLMICEVAADALGVGLGGAFAVASADNGRFTTASGAGTPANETAIGNAAQCAQWGKGEGNWVANDEWRVLAAYHYQNLTIQGGAGDLANPSMAQRAVVASGDVNLDFVNVGGIATGAMIFQLLYCWIGS